jgi:transposase
MEEAHVMTTKEIERLQVIVDVNCKKLTQLKAAELLNISDRQVRNLIKTYRKIGIKGFVSKKRGFPSNRAKSSNVKMEILSLIKTKYFDFKPTLAKEKLEECHQIRVSVETLRLDD